LTAEWCDLDIIASHYAYGNDYLCTLDTGRDAGTSSLFHSIGRIMLREDYKIEVLSPQELIDKC